MAEISLVLDSYVEEGSALVVGAASSASAARYTKHDEMIAALAGYIGSWDCAGTDDDIYSDGGRSVIRITALSISASQVLVTSAEGSVLLGIGSFSEGDMSLAASVLDAKTGITAMNINATGDDGSVGTAVRKFADLWTRRLDNVDVYDDDNNFLQTDNKTLFGAVNELKEGLSSVFRALMPDYASAVGVSSGWKCPYDGGWLRIRYYVRADRNVWVKIDGTLVAGYEVSRKADYSDSYFNSIVPISKGQTVTWQNQVSVSYLSPRGFQR